MHSTVSRENCTPSPKLLLLNYFLLSEPIAGFPSQLTVHVLTEPNSRIPGRDWNMTLFQDNRATQPYTPHPYTHHRVTPLVSAIGCTAKHSYGITPTQTCTKRHCVSWQLARYVAFSPGSCGIYSIQEALLFITLTQQMFGVISLGIWQSARQFKHLAYLSFLFKKHEFVFSIHYKHSFNGVFY